MNRIIGTESCIAHMHADAGVGRARTARHEGDTGASGHRPVGARHEADAALLSAGDDIDRGRVVQRVKHREEALARHVEDAVAPLRHKVVDEDPSAGALLCHPLALLRLRG
jgi:hypothetical protein